MNVKELIEVLQTMPQDAMAVVSGYEDGVDEVRDVALNNINLNVHDEWYYGAHELDKNGSTQAVYIG
jgi:hypothetical protein